MSLVNVHNEWDPLEEMIVDQVEDPGGPLTPEESSAEGFSIDIDTAAFEVEIDAIGDEITDDISGALDGLDDLDIPIFEDLGGTTDEKPNWPGVDAKQTEAEPVAEEDAEKAAKPKKRRAPRRRKKDDDDKKSSKVARNSCQPTATR